MRDIYKFPTHHICCECCEEMSRLNEVVDDLNKRLEEVNTENRIALDMDIACFEAAQQELTLLKSKIVDQNKVIQAVAQICSTQMENAYQLIEDLLLERHERTEKDPRRSANTHPKSERTKT